MTGGALTRDSGPNRWEEKEVDSLRRRLAEMEAQQARAKQDAPGRQDVVALENKLKSMQQKIEYSRVEEQVCAEKLAQARQQKTLKEGALKNLAQEVQELKKAIAKTEAALAKSHDKTRSIEQEVFADFSESVGVGNIREYEETNLREHQQLNQRRSALAAKRAQLESDLDYESKRDFEAPLKKFRKELERVSGLIAEKEQEQAAVVEREAGLTRAVAEAEVQVAAAANKRAAAESQVSE